MSRKAVATGVQTRAALYLRVSTGRQAVNDLSIPDQRRQLEVYCEANGWAATAETLTGVPRRIVWGGGVVLGQPGLLAAVERRARRPLILWVLDRDKVVD